MSRLSHVSRPLAIDPLLREGHVTCSGPIRWRMAGSAQERLALPGDQARGTLAKVAWVGEVCSQKFCMGLEMPQLY